MAETGGHPQATSKTMGKQKRIEGAIGSKPVRPRGKRKQAPRAVSKAPTEKPLQAVSKLKTDGTLQKDSYRQAGSVFTLKRALMFSIAGVLTCFALYHALLLSQDMLWGDFSARKLNVYPRYKFLRIPLTATALQYNAVNRLAADFAQIYFPAQKTSEIKEAYSDKTPDPWQRPSRYAPLLHFICSLTLCKLGYGHASLLHMLLQLILFFISFSYTFRALNITKELMPSTLLVIYCLFLTPVGLSWFERGQFSLYVAMAYLWLILGLIKGNIIYIIISALCAFIKWTSFPYASVILGLNILCSNNIGEIKHRLLIGLGYALVIVFCCMLLFKDSVEFIVGLFSQEIFFVPDGISLARLIPSVMVKVLPIILIIVGYLDAKAHRDGLVNSMPFVIGAAILMLTYPTIGCDYSVPCLFGIIPFVVYWSNSTIQNNHRYRQVIKYAFAVFLVTASFSIKLFQSEIVLVWYYVVSAVIFMISPYAGLVWGSLRIKIPRSHSWS